MADFSFSTEESDQKKKVTACPVDAEGPGWICRIDGHQLVGYICGCFIYNGDFMYEDITVVSLCCM